MRQNYKLRRVKKCRLTGILLQVINKPTRRQKYLFFTRINIFNLFIFCESLLSLVWPSWKFFYFIGTQHTFWNGEMVHQYVYQTLISWEFLIISGGTNFWYYFERKLYMSRQLLMLNWSNIAALCWACATQANQSVSGKILWLAHSYEPINLF